MTPVLHDFCFRDAHRFRIYERVCPECGSQRQVSFAESDRDSSNASTSTGNDSRPPWRKILYEEQPYADNYVDNKFMAGLIQNGALNVADSKLAL